MNKYIVRSDFGYLIGDEEWTDDQTLATRFGRAEAYANASYEMDDGGVGGVAVVALKPKPSRAARLRDRVEFELELTEVMDTEDNEAQFVCGLNAAYAHVLAIIEELEA